ncbi:hypothetical protein ACHQM5_026659 [Ranunculus cassubicifolius]
MAARSLSNNVKLVATFADTFSLAINRRGFAAVATQSGGAAASGVEKMMMKKTGAEKKSGVKGEDSWVPDPKTGYYRPENRGDEIDVAELREILLKRNN